MQAIDIAINYLKKKNNLNNIGNLTKEETLRVLMNITIPDDLPSDYYVNQDIVLKERLKTKKITDVNTLSYNNNITIYQGDITLIKADAIVNACNSQLLGCFHPLHNCIDNAIHSFGGLQIRRDLMTIMKNKEYEENGKCEVTKACNLSSHYIFHTVGPIVQSTVTNENKNDLKNCYLACLKKATQMNLTSIVFCSISTGIYNFPKDLASRIAVNTILEYKEKTKTNIKIIFNVFSDEDYKIYEQTFRELIK